MQHAFVGREHELDRFDRYWASGRAEFLALTGRRRVGKSRLLAHFFADKPHIHIVGTAQSARLQLVDASHELVRASGNHVLGHQPFASWEALLAGVAALAGERRFGVIFDECSYFRDQSQEFPEVLRRWWDEVGQRTQVVLVLASSHETFMGELFDADQPLAGRRTGDIRLLPFDPAVAVRFFPGYSPIDRLRAYGVFGGMPAYLASCDPEASLADNIRRQVLADGAFLRHEPLALLAQERTVNQPVGYLSVLRAIAAGQSQPSAIATALGARSPADIAPTLERLQAFGFVERVRPVTAESGGRISCYVVADPFLAFWCRFVQPAEALLDRGFADEVLAELFERPGGLDRFLARSLGPWQSACADYLWRALWAGLLGDLRFDRLGPWWEGRGALANAEIDLVGRAGQRTALVASCAWSDGLVRPGDLDRLRRDAARVGADEWTRYALFSRAGFDPVLVARAQLEHVLLVTPETMFGSET